MGWISYIVPEGIDRKREIKNNIEFGNKFEVVKAKLIGSRWYGLVREIKTGNVYGDIFLTRKDGWHFAYKEIGSYTSGYHDFPVSWIREITPPIEENAKREFEKWCEQCKQPKLSDLPIGTHIVFTDWQGEEHHAYKHEPAYQFKRAFWMCEDNSHYYKVNHIPDNWEVIG